MTTRRLIPVFLVLLQSGLTAAHAHAHSDSRGCSDVPHVHACELLGLFTPAHSHEDSDGDGDDHDADAVDLSDLMTFPAPPAVVLAALDLAPVPAGPMFEVVAGSLSFPRGLPHSTAGPPPPLYIAHCSLTI